MRPLNDAIAKLPEASCESILMINMHFRLWFRGLQSDAMNILAKCLTSTLSELREYGVLKKGMTNRSFLFRCKGEKYIMKIPGRRERLINKEHEYQVYEAL